MADIRVDSHMFVNKEHVSNEHETALKALSVCV